MGWSRDRLTGGEARLEDPHGEVALRFASVLTAPTASVCEQGDADAQGAEEQYCEDPLPPHDQRHDTSRDGWEPLLASATKIRRRSVGGWHARDVWRRVHPAVDRHPRRGKKRWFVVLLSGRSFRRG